MRLQGKGGVMRRYSVTLARLSIISIWSTFSTFSLVVIDQESNFISEKRSYFTQKMKRLPYDVTKKKVFLRWDSNALQWVLTWSKQVAKRPWCSPPNKTATLFCWGYLGKYRIYCLRCAFLVVIGVKRGNFKTNGSYSYDAKYCIDIVILGINFSNNSSFFYKWEIN